ncbi:sigma-70 family RNA polymerase sigma factor [Telmatocola sphagniphila]|uniref:Sigma-70 family RNA polymerase sigma factor n=1 Tax=Telmatocola sphagniphila TaxID=1123043 RepID=A0A8E6B2I6_9BACT|nr:sigma factor [Telmatocola sphagniphila]QVL30209.1 sigma-70 family RNA polymerase sigma factor [Telmatocola sphagniphila]
MRETVGCRHYYGMTPVAKYLRTLVPEFHARTDGELLTEFLLHHGEAPIVEILRRHGDWIWATCRRMLNHADAEDAFQATFLILTQRARKLQHSANIGPWLHRVAFLIVAKNPRPIPG